MRHWKVIVVPVLVAVVTLLPSGRAAALDCVLLTPEDALAQAHIVLVGRVTAAPPFWSGYGRNPHKVAVERVYKGSADPTITVMHNPNMGPDIRLEVGKRYLLFLRNRSEGWITSSCMGTRQLQGELPAEWAAALGPGNGPLPTAAKDLSWFVWGLPVLILVVAGLFLSRFRRSSDAER